MSAIGFRHHARYPASLPLPVGANGAAAAFEPVFHVGVADDAGISLTRSALVRVEYGGSTTLGRRTRVHIELEQHRFDTEIIFVEQLGLPYGLLGRRTIFSQFNEVVFLEKVYPPRVELRW